MQRQLPVVCFWKICLAHLNWHGLSWPYLSRSQLSEPSLARLCPCWPCPPATPCCLSVPFASLSSLRALSPCHLLLAPFLFFENVPEMSLLFFWPLKGNRAHLGKMPKKHPIWKSGDQWRERRYMISRYLEIMSPHIGLLIFIQHVLADFSQNPPDSLALASLPLPFRKAFVCCLVSILVSERSSGRIWLLPGHLKQESGNVPAVVDLKSFVVFLLFVLFLVRHLCCSFKHVLRMQQKKRMNK